MAQTTIAGTQSGGDIIAKINQLIDNGCDTVLLVNSTAQPQEESETIYTTDIIGIKSTDE